MTDNVLNLSLVYVIDGEIHTHSLGPNITTIHSFLFPHMRITSLTIPEGVTLIGEYAFSGNWLTSLQLPRSIVSIEPYAFYDNRINDLKIPNALVTIGMCAFAYNKISSLILPNNPITIQRGAFARNELTSLNIPHQITTIGDNAFAYNKLLKNVKLSPELADHVIDIFFHYYLLTFDFHDYNARWDFLFLNDVTIMNETNNSAQAKLFQDEYYLRELCTFI